MLILWKPERKFKLSSERTASERWILKSLLETQTAILNSLSNSKSMPGSFSSSRNCSIQNEEENMENKADKGKHKIKQSEQKQEKNVSKLYIENLNLAIKESDLVELFELSATKYLRETCPLNMPMNDKTGQSKGYAFVSAPKLWWVTQTKWSKFPWLSNQNRGGEIHKRAN